MASLSTILLKISTVVILFHLSNCALMLAPAVINKDFPSQCWNSQQEEPIPVGEIWQEPGCMRAACIEFRDKFYVEYATCGTIEVPKGCTTYQDESKPYPACCPRISCAQQEREASLGPEYEEFRNWVETYYDYVPQEYAAYD